METLDDDCWELEASVRHGNSSRAAAIAKKLAEKKATTTIRISELLFDVPEIPVEYATLLYINRCFISACHKDLV